MTTCVCPNPHCGGEELSQAYSGGYLHLYCQGCGYESKELSDAPRKEPLTIEDRRKQLGATVTSIKASRKKPEQKPQKVKLNRDRENYVPRRGTR